MMKVVLVLLSGDAAQGVEGHICWVLLQVKLRQVSEALVVLCGATV